MAHSMLDYSLGKEFASLRAHGTARIGSIFGRYPLIRSRNDNTFVRLAYAARAARAARAPRGAACAAVQTRLR